MYVFGYSNLHLVPEIPETVSFHPLSSLSWDSWPPERRPEFDLDLQSFATQPRKFCTWIGRWNGWDNILSVQSLTFSYLFKQSHVKSKSQGCWSSPLPTHSPFPPMAPRWLQRPRPPRYLVLLSETVKESKKSSLRKEIPEWIESKTFGFDIMQGNLPKFTTPL